jgi:hypothetical protein
LPKSRHRKGRPRTSTRSSTREIEANTSDAVNQPRDNRKMIAVIAIAAVVIIAGLFLYRNYRSKEVTTASGLKYIDVVEGTGASPKSGQMVKVHYTGTLENGTKFDSSVDRGRPFETKIGVGQVIKGWDEGIMTMKVGGKRKLIIPPKLGYGAQGQGSIPPNSTLHFDVELLDVK